MARRTDVEQAQRNKEELEVLQRKDRQLREAAEKRRKSGGAKICTNIGPFYYKPFPGPQTLLRIVWRFLLEKKKNKNSTAH